MTAQRLMTGIYNAQSAAAPATQVPLLTPGIALARRVPALKQDPEIRATCGPTSLESVLRYWQPFRNFGAPNEFGTAAASAVNSYNSAPRLEALGPCMFWNDPNGLAMTARQAGLFAKVEVGPQIDLFRNQLAEWLARGETVIVHRVLDGVSAAEGHYTVVDGIDGLGVHMMDPWPDSPQYTHVPWSTFIGQFKNQLNPLGLAIRISGAPIL